MKTKKQKTFEFSRGGKKRKKAIGRGEKVKVEGGRDRSETGTIKKKQTERKEKKRPVQKHKHPKK